MAAAEPTYGTVEPAGRGDAGDRAWLVNTTCAARTATEFGGAANGDENLDQPCADSRGPSGDAGNSRVPVTIGSHRHGPDPRIGERRDLDDYGDVGIVC